MEVVTYGVFGLFIIIAFLLGRGMKSENDDSELKNELREIINHSQDAVKSTLTSEIRDRNNDSRDVIVTCLLYTSPSPRDGLLSRMPSSA